jgi:hypothetical protein
MKKLLCFTAITIMSLAGCGGKTNSENSPSTTQIPWYKTMPNYSPDYSPPSNNYSPPQYNYSPPQYNYSPPSNNYSPPSNNYSSNDDYAPEFEDLGPDTGIDWGE